MRLDAQVGALGHELAHTVDFQQTRFGGMLRVLLGNLSRKYLDRQEFSTDERAIDHGLGFQLFAWHVITSKAFKMPQDSSSPTAIPAQERYMSPATVIRKMRSKNLYVEYQDQIDAL